MAYVDMIFWAILVIVAVVCATAGSHQYSYSRLAKYWQPWLEGWKKLFAIPIGAVVALGVSATLHLAITPVEYKNTGYSKMAALGTDQILHGSFFLGSGRVNGETVYAYMLKDERGGLRIYTVKTLYAVIYEDATPATARLELWKGYNEPWIGSAATQSVRYEFHVPPNTVVQDYSVDVSD